MRRIQRVLKIYQEINKFNSSAIQIVSKCTMGGTCKKARPAGPAVIAQRGAFSLDPLKRLSLGPRMKLT